MKPRGDARRGIFLEHTRPCKHCTSLFTQPGKRGTLRSYCSDACRDAARQLARGPQRRALYQTLRLLGAHPAVAQRGSQGPANFKAAVHVLSETEES